VRGFVNLPWTGHRADGRFTRTKFMEYRGLGSDYSALMSAVRMDFA
jgi:hypothetical protein